MINDDDDGDDGGDRPVGAAFAVVEAVARTSYGRLVAYLASVTGDLASAEDALGDALVAALTSWPVRGIPDRPETWLLTAARRRLVDAHRHRKVAAAARASIVRAVEERWEKDHPAVPDDRLRLMFACAHPAIAPAVRTPLILQTVLGIDAARMAEVFMVPPATMGQRLVRAKAKIREAGIRFRIPDEEELPERLDAVLGAVYAAYTTGWEDADALDPARGHLADEAIRLARVIVSLLPAEPEARGLLSLLLHSHARREARRNSRGEFVPLDRQDIGRWSRELIAEAEGHLAEALRGARPGPYQLQAAVQSVHNRRALTGSTDWRAVALLYDGLVRLTPTFGVAVARAAAYREAHGAEAGLRLLAELPLDAVSSYQPFWTVRAYCERDLGAPDAVGSARRALDLTLSPTVRAHLSAELLTG